MNLNDIKTAILEKLNSTKCLGKTYAERGTYDVFVSPCEIENINTHYELATVNVELRYAPKVETSHQCIKIAEILETIFTEPITVNGRVLDTDGLCIEHDAGTISLSFRIAILQHKDANHIKY